MPEHELKKSNWRTVYKNPTVLFVKGFIYLGGQGVSVAQRYSDLFLNDQSVTETLDSERKS